ncbi:MAG: exonuclease VII small subunit [Nitratiruptor sp.]|nr:exonuclease VII small subunit [Nitratiruptor sp.]NPA84331.1 exodeoxyribonuclease VII small subunit [Campylobacterota bacterium]
MREFEELIQRAQAILDRLMEERDLGLQESMELYKEAMGLLERAKGMVDRAQIELEEITKKEERCE